VPLAEGVREGLAPVLRVSRGVPLGELLRLAVLLGEPVSEAGCSAGIMLESSRLLLTRKLAVKTGPEPAAAAGTSTVSAGLALPSLSPPPVHCRKVVLKASALPSVPRLACCRAGSALSVRCMPATLTTGVL
jgi:hypothetical protein